MTRPLFHRISDALDACHNSAHVNHVRANNGRVVAIRPTGGSDWHAPGLFDLTFSHPDIDHRPHGDDGKWSVTRTDATRSIKTFMTADVIQNVDIIYFDQHINQQWRECEIVKRTPTRVRLSYELPRTGFTHTWRYYLDLGATRYLSLE